MTKQTSTTIPNIIDTRHVNDSRLVPGMMVWFHDTYIRVVLTDEGLPVQCKTYTYESNAGRELSDLYAAWCSAAIPLPAAVSLHIN